jgi:hypothetical protein
VRICIRSFRVLLLAALCAGGGAAFSQTAENASALAALKLVPADKAANVARIVGRDGTPVPQRWYFVTYDAAELSGVREFVVAEGELVAARPMSQFAAQAAAADVIGMAEVKVDSKRAGEIAADYARVNNTPLGTLNYELAREGLGAAPVWKVTCLDAAGRQLGVVALTATRGAVVSHDGFLIDPTPETQVKKVQKPDTSTDEKVAPQEKTDTASDDGEQRKTARHRHRAGNEEQSGVEHAFKKMGGVLQKFFTGRDTIND